MLKREPWHIQVRRDGQVADVFSMFVAECLQRHLVTLCEMLSTKHPDCSVILTAQARVRKIWEAGKVTKDWPSLKHFYTNVSTQSEYSWKNLGFLWEHID